MLSILAMESADSIRLPYRHFLAGITKKSLNAFYYACSYAKADYSRFMNVTVGMALKLIPERLQTQPVFLCIDDTMVPNFGKKFEDVSKLFDHAAHNGSNHYLSAPLGYRMWQKKESKLELAASMIWHVMPVFHEKKNVIILCDSWYVKKNLVSVIDEYENLDILGNARSNSVIYDLPLQRTGKRGRPALHGKKLSIQNDFTLSDEKIGDYYMAVRRVLTNILEKKTILAYVTSADKVKDSRRLFFSTVFPEQLQLFCAWQEKYPLNQTGNSRMNFIPLMLYTFRWPIEVSYYEQKTFWLLCSYMVRSRIGIEMLVNLINISYCAMKLLPY